MRDSLKGNYTVMGFLVSVTLWLLEPADTFGLTAFRMTSILCKKVSFDALNLQDLWRQPTIFLRSEEPL